jgi:FixJ family two-component response regulator
MIERQKQCVIAVVDDDQRVLESLGSLLESADYAVRLFESAAAMLGSRCLSGISCLISDIDMPVMDGFELLTVVQAERDDLPIILITGQSNKLNQFRTVGQGRFPLLKKPFDAQDLLTMIAEALNRQGRP